MILNVQLLHDDVKVDLPSSRQLAIRNLPRFPAFCFLPRLWRDFVTPWRDSTFWPFAPAPLPPSPSALRSLLSAFRSSAPLSPCTPPPFTFHASRFTPQKYRRFRRKLRTCTDRQACPGGICSLFPGHVSWVLTFHVFTHHVSRCRVSPSIRRRYAWAQRPCCSWTITRRSLAS